MFFVWLCASLLACYATYVWAVSSIPWVGHKRRALAYGLLGLCVVPAPLTWLLLHSHHSSQAIAYAGGILSAVMVTLLISAGPLALVHDLCRRVFTPPVSRQPEFPPTSEQVNRRQLVEAAAGVAVLGATGSMIGWGIVRGRHAFELTEIPVRIVGLPRVLDGYVIAQVSDIHSGAFIGERELDEGFELVKRARPDLLVVTGDLVDIDAADTGLVARKLRAVAPRDGVIASLGNHDYYSSARRVARDLRAAGIDVLVNEGRVLRGKDGGGFALLGVDDRSAPRYGGVGPRLDEALAGTPPELPRILLSHQPTTVDQWAGRVALQLSGHTHGGQINPGSRSVNVFFEYLAGLYSVGGTSLYVNRGFGTVGPPVRIGAPPEISRFVLISA